MRTCENHEDETSRHMMRQDRAMVAVCCDCWLKAGNNPSKHHECS